MNAVNHTQLSIFNPQSMENDVKATFRSAVKNLAIAIFAFAVTLLLFWLMSLVISQSGKPPAETTPYVAINPVFNEKEIETHFNETLPQPPKMLEAPKVPSRAMEPNDSETTTGFGGDFEVAAPEVDTTATTSLNMTGGDARPIVRISPQYPVTAARDGIEGWVQLSFSINELGGVEDIVVVDAEPKRIFNREATRALRKWKYRPKMVDGQPVKQVNMTVQLDFNLEGSAAQ